jgi:hypothetical protein
VLLHHGHPRRIEQLDADPSLREPFRPEERAHPGDLAPIDDLGADPEHAGTPGCDHRLSRVERPDGETVFDAPQIAADRAARAGPGIPETA